MWRRVCLDINDAGIFAGWSVEWHDSDGRIVEVVAGRPGPFDSVRDGLELGLVVTRRQAQLWNTEAGL